MAKTPNYMRLDPKDLVKLVAVALKQEAEAESEHRPLQETFDLAMKGKQKKYFTGIEDLKEVPTLEIIFSKHHYREHSFTVKMKYCNSWELVKGDPE